MLCLSKSLEELERELVETEPIIERKKGKKIPAIILGYLFWLFSYVIIYIYLNPGAYGNVSDLIDIILTCLIQVPALGYPIIEPLLAGDYYTTATLALVPIIGGFIAGLVARDTSDGILVGALIWIIGACISVGVSLYSIGSFSSDVLLGLVDELAGNSLFLDPLLLSILGALGGFIRRSR